MRESNHDALVKVIIDRLHSIKNLKEKVLGMTGRKYITRLTFKRAMETATRALLESDILSYEQESVNEQVSICKGNESTT